VRIPEGRIAGQADLGSALSGALEGVDPTTITDAMSTRFDGVTYTDVSRTAGTAKVRLTGTLTIAFDTAKMTAIVRKALDAQGTPADDTMITALLGSMTDTLEQGRPLAWTFDLVPEGGRWVICGLDEAVPAAT
jgi:hypothetical protein